MTPTSQTDIADLGRRLALLEDREAIRELTARYCWLVTRGEAEAVSALYTADGVFEVPAPDGGRHETVGRAAIFQRLASVRPGQVCPIVGNHIIAVTGDEAVGTCAMRNTPRDVEGNLSQVVGFYRDQYRREDGGWRFAARRWFIYVPVYDVG